MLGIKNAQHHNKNKALGMNAVINFFKDLVSSDAAEEKEWGAYALEDLIELDDDEDATPEEKADLRKLTPRQSRRVRVLRERALASAQTKMTSDTGA
jgi:hypothetical protein